MFFDIYGNEITKPDGVIVKPRFSVYGVTYLNSETLIFTRGAHSEMLELPGGGIEENESHAQTLRREGLEECGFVIIPCSKEPFHQQGPNGFCFPAEDRYYHSTGYVYEAFALGWQLPNFVLDLSEVSEVLRIKTYQLQIEDVHPLFRDAVHKSLTEGRGSKWI